MSGEDYIPSVVSVSFSPPRLEIGKGLGRLGGFSATIRDHAHRDRKSVV